ncbi:MAG: hypothetical protein ACI9XZ_001334, partial [Alphaproteobacteria bacterium]
NIPKNHCARPVRHDRRDCGARALRVYQSRCRRCTFAMEGNIGTTYSDCAGWFWPFLPRPSYSTRASKKSCCHARLARWQTRRSIAQAQRIQIIIAGCLTTRSPVGHNLPVMAHRSGQLQIQKPSVTARNVTLTEVTQLAAEGDLAVEGHNPLSELLLFRRLMRRRPSPQ